MKRCGFAFLILVSLACSLRAEEVTVPGGKVELHFDNSASKNLQRQVEIWVQRAGKAVATYYHGYPVRDAVLEVQFVAGHGASGQASGWNGRRINITLSRSITPAELTDDWTLTHEMLHLAFPSVPERHHWIEEGIATYVEPIARARAGLLTPERIWGDMVEGMPQGLPERGDRGLDHTPTWGRTYWGGALFCLRADVEIRRRTQNRFGLEHALRAIVEAGGTIDVDWPLERVIAVGDRATGVPVLREIYDEMKAAPDPVDLPALWKQLGVERQGQTIRFHADAPLAAIREAITKGQ